MEGEVKAKMLLEWNDQLDCFHQHLEKVMVVVVVVVVEGVVAQTQQHPQGLFLKMMHQHWMNQQIKGF